MVKKDFLLYPASQLQGECANVYIKQGRTLHTSIFIPIASEGNSKFIHLSARIGLYFGLLRAYEFILKTRDRY